MNIENAKFTNEDNTQISVLIDGQELSVPVDLENRHYAAIVESGAAIADYASPMPTVDDVRAEAQRRIIALVGARDAAHLEIIITNGLREAARLLQKEVDGVVLTVDEQTRKTLLAHVDMAIEAIRTASNVLEVMDPVPLDFADDAHWS